MGFSLSCPHFLVGGDIKKTSPPDSQKLCKARIEPGQTCLNLNEFALQSIHNLQSTKSPRAMQEESRPFCGPADKMEETAIPAGSPFGAKDMQ